MKCRATPENLLIKSKFGPKMRDGPAHGIHIQILKVWQEIQASGEILTSLDIWIL